MRALSAGELLDVWEAGQTQCLTDRAVALLAFACPEASRDSLALLSIGPRDAKLLALREEIWGPVMAAMVVCPGCQDRLELNLDTREMQAHSLASQPGDFSLSIAGYNVTFRLPCSMDMVAMAGQSSVEACRAMILGRCLISAQHGGEPVDSDKLPPEVSAGISECMAESDPLANIQLDLTCPSCEHRWDIVFDIVSFFWTELEVWAWRILSDVHTLASAYSWCERDILTLTPMRRQFYLEMVGA